MINHILKKTIISLPTNGKTQITCTTFQLAFNLILNSLHFSSDTHMHTNLHFQTSTALAYSTHTKVLTFILQLPITHTNIFQIIQTHIHNLKITHTNTMTLHDNHSQYVYSSSYA